MIGLFNHRLRQTCGAPQSEETVEQMKLEEPWVGGPSRHGAAALRIPWDAQGVVPAEA